MDYRKRLISIVLSICLVWSSAGMLAAFADSSANDGDTAIAVATVAASESASQAVETAASSAESASQSVEAAAASSDEEDEAAATDSETVDYNAAENEAGISAGNSYLSDQNCGADLDGQIDGEMGSRSKQNDGDSDVDYAADSDQTGSASGEFTEGLPSDAFNNLNIGSDEELLEGYLMSHAASQRASRMELSSRGWNLSGNNLFYYEWVRSLAQSVAAGKRSDTIDSVAGSKILSKKTYSAADLGLKVVAKPSGTRLVLTDAAKEKLNKLMVPEDWSAVVTAAMLDMPYELYWYNRYNSTKCLYRVYWDVSFTATSITFNTDPSKTYAEIMLPLIEDYGLKNGSMYYIYRADTSMTGAAAKAITNAKSIVARHADESDYNKLKSYLNEVCALTDYDYAAADLIDSTLQDYEIYNSPWQLISVFDGDASTKVVCAGYGKAYKYLCDISAFDSNWTECQTMYGTVQRVGSTDTPGSHLWCVVRMSNGKNYIVDPTWHDSGYNMFLQGGSYSDSTGSCDVKTTLNSSGTYTIRYTYSNTMKKSFSAAELRIDSSDYDPESAAAADVPISLVPARVSGIKAKTYTGAALTGQHPVVKVDGRTLTEGVDYTIGGYKSNVKVGKGSFVITGIGQYTGTVTKKFNIVPKGTTLKTLKKGKKSITVKWKKQSAKMSSARVTGYQIQYSTSSRFASGNKTVTVKGYKKTSKTVKKLKAKKKYYVRIRTYLKTGGVTYYSPWSAAKAVKTR